MSFNPKLVFAFALLSMTQATLPAQEQRASAASTGTVTATRISPMAFEEFIQEASLDKLYAQAVKCFSEDNKQLAIEIYARILTINQNYIPSLNALASCLLYNQGIPSHLNQEQRYAGAVLLWTNAANQGNAEAQFNLGACYFKNQGISSNPTQEERYIEAVRLWKLAASQGYAKAQYYLGACYFKNQGVLSTLTQEERNAEAVRLLTLAANQGHSEAAWVLAKCYIDGLGVSRDYDKALALCEQALQKSDEIKLSLFYKMYQKRFLPQCSGFKKLAHCCFTTLVDRANPEIHAKLAREKRVNDQIEATAIESCDIGGIDYASEPCPICRTSFEVNQKIMLFSNNAKSCFHVLCQNCLDGLRSSGLVFRCPLCREVPTTVSPITVMSPATQASRQQHASTQPLEAAESKEAKAP